VIVIVWKLDLQLPLQSVHFTTHVHGEVYSIQHYVIKFVSDKFSLGTLASSINKTDRHDFNVKHNKPNQANLGIADFHLH
jgi:hypothetical protein